ncbi:hypothetical protein MUK42_36141 [Musa troglodytarum]|uniref:Uncharacterized protein n=1 Tax=Musa troglodytarum TaxID=320322 RepID=A0A9E7JXP3_9LILI|nr:hypothetical protein MUK42_36141 [Musa troglodytarum]
MFLVDPSNLNLTWSLCSSSLLCSCLLFRRVPFRSRYGS